MRDSSEHHVSKIDAIRHSLKRLAGLYIESAKLTAAEKMTLFLSAAVAFIIAMIFMTFAIAFGAVALLDLFEMADLSPIAAAGILSGTFLILAVLIFVLRKPLIVNPMARFVSKLIMDIGNDPTKP